jgi:hypothetical protein
MFSARRTLSQSPPSRPTMSSGTVPNVFYKNAPRPRSALMASLIASACSSLIGIMLLESGIGSLARNRIRNSRQDCLRTCVGTCRQPQDNHADRQQAVDCSLAQVIATARPGIRSSRPGRQCGAAGGSLNRSRCLTCPSNMKMKTPKACGSGSSRGARGVFGGTIYSSKVPPVLPFEGSKPTDYRPGGATVAAWHHLGFAIWYRGRLRRGMSGRDVGRLGHLCLDHLRLGEH